MKKYVFITFSVVGIGGGQLYVRNKVDYLKRNGWQVFVYSANYGDVLIKQLDEYKKNINRDLGFAPKIFSKRHRNKLISGMAKEVGRGDYAVVESSSVILGIWGEALAERLNATHLLFSLEERNSVLSLTHLDFLSYKWRQHALAGIMPQSVKTMFAENGVTIPEEKSYRLLAHSNNSVEDVEFENILMKTDYTICLFGRLEKPFIKPTAESLASYIRKHRDRTYNVIIVGGGGKKLSEDIRNCFKGDTNCNVLMTGYLFPVPYKLVKSVDIAISSAGSCSVFSRFGVVTISIDGRDLKPIGFYGITTKSLLFRPAGEPIQELDELLDQCLEEKKYITSILPYKVFLYDFEDHMGFLLKIDSSFDYYDISSINIGWRRWILDKMKYAGAKIFGPGLYAIFANMVKKTRWQ